MEWVRSLNKAIDYIEDNLLSELTCEGIAAQVYISIYHFQRVFSLLTGMTVGEYIRNRRLSLAGQELIMSNVKVIDVALKYGYDTPESFAKAFSRFHGVTPNQAKMEGSNLKSFNRLVIKIRLKAVILWITGLSGKILFRLRLKQELFHVKTVEKKFQNFGQNTIPMVSMNRYVECLEFVNRKKRDQGNSVMELAVSMRLIHSFRMASKY